MQEELLQTSVLKIMERVLIKTVKSGTNYQMKSWNKKSKNIIEIQKDRFIRFGYVCFKKICKKFNTTIVVGKCETKINQNVQKKTNLKTSLNDLEKIE